MHEIGFALAHSEEAPLEMLPPPISGSAGSSFQLAREYLDINTGERTIRPNGRKDSVSSQSSKGRTLRTFPFLHNFDLRPLNVFYVPRLGDCIRIRVCMADFSITKLGSTLRHSLTILEM